jgi:hypothetical protein
MTEVLQKRCAFSLPDHHPLGFGRSPVDADIQDWMFIVQNSILPFSCSMEVAQVRKMSSPELLTMALSELLGQTVC